MRDAFSWSFPVGSLFGISIRVHFLVPLIIAGLVARAAWQPSPSGQLPMPGYWIDVAVILGLMVLSVLIHEFGHCFAARRVGGDADSVLLWPLGGLARTNAPHTPWATFVVAIGGPLANVVLFVAAALTLAFAVDQSYQPPWNPLDWPARIDVAGEIGLTTWAGVADRTSAIAPVLLARIFWVNWVLFLFNMVLVGLPFDSGRILQAVLWPRFGYHQATLYAIFAGFGIMAILCGVTLFKNEVMLLILAWYTYSACKQEWLTLETGGEDSVFGYDFSQGYTSLERGDDAPPAAPPRRRRGNFLQRWLQRRAAKKLQLDGERREAEDRRMDELLEKIQRYGKSSLTDEEQRFLRRVSDRYRNKP